MSQNFFSMNTFIPFSNEFSFTLHRSNNGYKLVSPGYKISRQEFEKVFYDISDDSWMWEGRKHLIAISPPLERFSKYNSEYLLMPMGKGIREERQFSKNKKPLFQSFIDLSSDDEILSFANIHGCLSDPYEDWPNLNEAEKFFFPLESIGLWKREIAAMKQIIEAVKCIEEGRRIQEMISFWESSINNIDKEMIEKFPFFFKILPFYLSSQQPGYSLVYDSPYHGLLQIIAICCNSKLHRYHCIPKYTVLYSGQPEAYLEAETLAGALWLELTHSIFKDGPEHLIAHRCFYCGRYDREGMHQRKKEPNAGLWYHETCKCAFYNRERRRKEREKKSKAS